MIETVILNHLKNKLSVPVHTDKPEPMPAEFVLFERAGRGKNNKLPSSVFAFQSYSTSTYNAAKLNEEVESAVESLIEADDVAGVKFNSSYNFPDLEYKKPRYQAVFDIRHY